VLIACGSISLLAPPSAVGAVKLTQRESKVSADAAYDKHDEKRFDSFGAWSDSAQASNNGTCPDGQTQFSAMGQSDQDSSVTTTQGGAEVTVDGTITGSGSGACFQPPSPAGGGGSFVTEVLFEVTGDPVKYSAAGTLGPGEGRYGQVWLFKETGEVFNVLDKPGPYSFSGILQPGQYHLGIQVELGGQSVNSSSSLDFRLGPSNKCKKPNKKTGTGYDGLTSEMKAALGRLYDELDAIDACYRFNIGKRSQEYQDDLRRRWHDIADKPEGDHRTAAEIEQRLKNAGFAQVPTGYNPPNAQGLRVAKGGPAVRSRHTAGQAADLTVTFPRHKNLGKFQDAARTAGLCGPPAADPVHVELPYKRKDRHHRHRRVFGCHFPEGPAP
jgi:hypothetical protein